jgi:hypothetical protein
MEKFFEFLERNFEPTFYQEITIGQHVNKDQLKWQTRSFGEV